MCVCISDKAVSSDFSQYVELPRDYRGKKTEITIKNNTVTCFAFWKDLSVQGFGLSNSFSGGVERLFCAVLDF